MGHTANPVFVLRWCAVAATAVVVVGCAQAPTEEAEHAHYDFKPVDFPDAVNKLEALQVAIVGREQTQALAANQAQNPPDPSRDDGNGGQSRDGQEVQRETPLRQWHLIVRWLPETAADSDLKRDSWERIADPARRLFDLTSSWEWQPENEQQEKFQEHQQALTAVLKELRDLADSEYPTSANAGSKTQEN